MAVSNVSNIPGARLKLLDELLSKLGVVCGRMKLVEEALTHSSFTAENPDFMHNERLEFFGDSVLKFVISEYLLERFPDYDEGQLSEIRAVLVSSKILANVASDLNLGKYIRTGRRVSMKPSILADGMEAVFGAIYLDSGLFSIQNLIIRLLGAQATTVDRDYTKDNYKARLQEYTQARNQGIPVYTLLDTQGPPHNPVFQVAVEINATALAEGSGSSKKEAEQAAAKLALSILGEIKDFN